MIIVGPIISELDQLRAELEAERAANQELCRQVDRERSARFAIGTPAPCGLSLHHMTAGATCRMCGAPAGEHVRYIGPEWLESVDESLDSKDRALVQKARDAVLNPGMLLVSDGLICRLADRLAEKEKRITELAGSEATLEAMRADPDRDENDAYARAERNLRFLITDREERLAVAAVVEAFLIYGQTLIQRRHDRVRRIADGYFDKLMAIPRATVEIVPDIIERQAKRIAELGDALDLANRQVADIHRSRDLHVSDRDAWRVAIETALGLESDPANHTIEWAAEAILAIREIGNDAGGLLRAARADRDREALDRQRAEDDCNRWAARVKLLEAKLDAIRTTADAREVRRCLR